MKVITCSLASPIFCYSSSGGAARSRCRSEAVGVPLTEAGTAGDGLLPCRSLVVVEQENNCRWRPANFTASKKMGKRSLGWWQQVYRWHKTVRSGWYTSNTSCGNTVKRKSHKAQQGEVESPAPGKKNPMHQYILEANRLEGSLAEKALGVLVGIKLNLS